ncbi:MAG: tetratricopeptide repeat protein [Gemmatimonadetes bacterium]|nr:tetratricopeptide repeat protein [Gemmatimonadota bacterium]
MTSTPPSDAAAAPSASSGPDASARETSASLATRIGQMQRALDDASAVSTPEARAALKDAIVVLYREADAALREAEAMKEAVRALAQQWKTLGPDAPTPSLRVDHLGASTFIEKAWSRLSLNDPVAAEAALRDALALAPGSNEAETLLGWALMLQARYDEALGLFQAVLQRDPSHALARTNVGYVCLRKGIYGEAIEHLSSAIRSGTDRKATLYAHLYLGMVYAERDMVDDASLFFHRALELGPNLLQAWYELGRALWRAGRVEEAREAWRAGAEANKLSPWGKRCRDVLAQVEQGGALVDG